MESFDCDLHYHGPFAGGTSKNMLLPVIAEQARLKGLDCVTTAYITHAKWFEHVKANIVEEEHGVFMDKEQKVHVVVGTEVCTNDRVHHVLFFPDLTSAASFKEGLEGQVFSNLRPYAIAEPVSLSTHRAVSTWAATDQSRRSRPECPP